MPLIPFGVQLCWPSECAGCEKSKIYLRSRVAAEQWLTRISLNPQAMASLHNAAVQCGIAQTKLLNKRSIVRAVAEQLAAGRIRACDANWREIEFQTGGTTSNYGAPDQDEGAAPFPLQDRAARAPSQSAQQAADPSTFPDPINPAAQMQALASAAAQGVPFCPE